MTPQEKIAERVADAGFPVAGGSWLGINLVSLNQVLETVTLTIGILAGLFSLFFHIRRWLNERKKRETQ